MCIYICINYVNTFIPLKKKKNTETHNTPWPDQDASPMGRDDWDGRNGFDLAMLHRSVRRERHELHSALSRFFSLVADASVFNSSWAMEKGKCKKFTSLSLSLSPLLPLYPVRTNSHLHGYRGPPIYRGSGGLPRCL